MRRGLRVLDRSEIIKKLKEDLGRERFDHSLRVEKTAIALARKFGVSIKKASIAALLHDCARKFDRAGLLREARRLRLKIDPISRLEPKLLHAELSSRFAKKDFKIRSPEILSAIRRHTIGAERMTKLEKIIFLADHVEEGRNYAGVKKIRRIAFRDLDRAIIESTSGMLKYLEDKKLPVHPGTIKTRNYYLMKK